MLPLARVFQSETGGAVYSVACQRTVCLSVRPSVRLCVCLLCMFACLPVCLHVCLSVCVFALICLPIRSLILWLYIPVLLPTCFASRPLSACLAIERSLLTLQQHNMPVCQVDQYLILMSHTCML